MPLVLARRTGQKLIFDHPHLGGVEVSVHSVLGKTVKLAITAPKEVTIRRGEIATSTRRPQEAAGRPA